MKQYEAKLEHERYIRLSHSVRFINHRDGDGSVQCWHAATGTGDVGPPQIDWERQKGPAKLEQTPVSLNNGVQCSKPCSAQEARPAAAATRQEL